MATNNSPHIPVMLTEVLADLQPHAQEIYIDATFGAGGYTRAILQATSCQVYALDRDPDVLPYAQELMAQFPYNFHFIRGEFSKITQLLADNNIHQVDGIVMDIGVSSMQLDIASRGFAFSKDAPLDMRMDSQNPNLPTAYDIVNIFSEKRLAEIIYTLGDEYFSHKIAKNIVTARKVQPIETTGQLAELVRQAYPVALRHKVKIDPATKTFQALRIFINQELDELSQALSQTISLLNPGGRLIVVTFHSLEDRIVKEFLQQESGYLNRTKHNKYKASSSDSETFNFTLLHKKPQQPSEAEIIANPRARSAKLRSARRN